MRRLLALAKKELLQLKRDRMTLAMTSATRISPMK